MTSHKETVYRLELTNDETRILKDALDRFMCRDWDEVDDPKMFGYIDDSISRLSTWDRRFYECELEAMEAALIYVEKTKILARDIATADSMIEKLHEIVNGG